MTGELLKQILDKVREQEDLQPHDGITYCNIATDRILGLCGIPRMVNKLNGKPLMANDMIDFMANSPSRFIKVNGVGAYLRANGGALVFACQKGDVHGHLCPIYPIDMGFSPSWGKDVPFCSNVGKVNKVLRASQCFHDEPVYYSVIL